jgi:nucleoside-diphosphate kinase
VEHSAVAERRGIAVTVLVERRLPQGLGDLGQEIEPRDLLMATQTRQSNELPVEPSTVAPPGSHCSRFRGFRRRSSLTVQIALLRLENDCAQWENLGRCGIMIAWVLATKVHLGTRNTREDHRPTPVKRELEADQRDCRRARRPVKHQAVLILIKPDGLKKSLTGNIITRLSETKLEIVAARMVRVSKELAEEHYKHLNEERFFPELIRYIRGELHDRRKVMALVYWGRNAIGKCRKLAGVTNPEEAESTSIRGSYGRITTSGLYENVIHVSSTKSEAEREIKLWFTPDQIIVDLYPTEEVVEDKRNVVRWR